MEPILSLSGIAFGYNKHKPLFQNLDLQLNPGHIYGLFGQNGTGKTTLLKHMVGTLFPWEGTAKVFGYPAQERMPEVLADIFMVPENFSLPELAMKDYIKVHKHFYPRFDEDQFERHAEEFEIIIDQKLPQLSYGQQKKALLAFALATNARLLVMDEPTNGLDIPSKSQFRKTLAGALRHDQVVLISTHQVRDLANLIDEVIVLESGQILFQKSIDAIGDHLAFQAISDEELQNAIYAESTFGGYKAIMPQDGKATEIDMELLFNGVIKQPYSIHQAFQKS